LPRLKIRLGKQVIESPDVPIETFIKLNNVLKKFSSSVINGALKLDWRAIAFFNDLIARLEEGGCERVFIESIKDAVQAALREIPKIIFENDGVLLLVHNYDPKAILNELGGDMRFRIIKTVRFGDIEVPYLAYKYQELPRLYGAIDNEELDENFRSILVALRNQLVTKNKVKVSPYGVKYIEVRIPIHAPRDLIEKIKELGVIEYYVLEATKDEMILRQEKVYKINKTDSELVLRLPSYAISRICEIVSNYGYITELDVKIPASIKVKLDKKFTLMPFQEEAINTWLQRNKLGTIVVPTGGGKTFIGLAAIEKLRVPSIVFVPNKLLLWQWRDRVSQFLGISLSDIGILGAGYREIRDITIATYQSGVKYIDKIADKFALVIFDEGHHVPAKTFKEVALYLRAPYRMALSATPKRHDKNEILLFRLAGEIVYEISYQKLVIQGFLAPLAVRKVLVPLPKELVPVYNRLENELKNVENPIEKKVKINKLIELARDNPNKIGVIREIVNKHKDEKMFIFAGSIKFAEMIKTAIKDIVPAAVLTAKTSELEEKKIAEAFKRGDIRALVLVKKGEEGLDVGDASVAIITGGSKQVREFIQRVGRVLRGGRNKLAWVYEIVTMNTIEEAISRARRARDLVRGIEDYILKNFGVKAFRVIRRML